MSLAPWPARPFVVSFVAAVVVCGAFSIEAWPLTGFRLFSRERQEVATGWMETSVDGRGRETRIRVARFPPPSRYFVAIMATYERLPAADQAATVAGLGAARAPPRRQHHRRIAAVRDHPHVGAWMTLRLDYSAWVLCVVVVLVTWPAVADRLGAARTSRAL